MAKRAATRPELMAGGELPDELFRVGFALADGSKATWLGTGGGALAAAIRPDQPPNAAVLSPLVGGGGSQRWSQDLCLWPLPPEGRLEFVCEWRELGIELTRAQLDSEEIREAAGRIQTLWESGHTPSAPGPTTRAPF